MSGKKGLLHIANISHNISFKFFFSIRLKLIVLVVGFGVVGSLTIFRFMSSIANCNYLGCDI